MGNGLSGSRFSYLLLVGLLWLSAAVTGRAQQTDSAAAKPELWGFLDSYYAYNFSRPADLSNPPFLYSHHRHNAFSINNAIAGLRYADDRVRGAVALHTGTYVQQNYAAEPELFRLLYEATAGFSPLHRVWVEAGVFPSHIGFESAISADNWTLTRSLMAENSPYYEAGAKVSWQPHGKWSFTGLVLNGWQVIYETDKYKAFGTQVQWQPSARWLLNSSTYLGKEGPDSLSGLPRNRFFHNFFVRYQPERGLQLALVADVGVQQLRRGGRGSWHTAAVMARYPLSSKWAVAGRAEYYYDPNGLVVGAEQSFDADAVSLNLDFAPAPRVLWRLEARHLGWQRLVYQNGIKQTILTTSLSVKL